MPVCAPCGPVCLSTSRMTLGKFWGSVASVSPPLHTSRLSWRRCSMVCLCVPVMGKRQGRGPFGRVSDGFWKSGRAQVVRTGAEPRSSEQGRGESQSLDALPNLDMTQASNYSS